MRMRRKTPYRYATLRSAQGVEPLHIIFYPVFTGWKIIYPNPQIFFFFFLTSSTDRRRGIAAVSFYSL